MSDPIASVSTLDLTPSTFAADSPSSAVVKYVAGYFFGIFVLALLYVLWMDEGDGMRLIWYRAQATVAHRVALPISSWGFKAEAKYRRTLDRNRTV